MFLIMVVILFLAYFLFWALLQSASRPSCESNWTNLRGYQRASGTGRKRTGRKLAVLGTSIAGGYAIPAWSNGSKRLHLNCTI